MIKGSFSGFVDTVSNPGRQFPEYCDVLMSVWTTLPKQALMHAYSIEPYWSRAVRGETITFNERHVREEMDQNSSFVLVDRDFALE